MTFLPSSPGGSEPAADHVEGLAALDARPNPTTAPAERHRIAIELNVEIDAEHIHALAMRHGRPLNLLIAELVADCECRASDAIRWRDGVVRVGVQSR